MITIITGFFSKWLIIIPIYIFMIIATYIYCMVKYPKNDKKVAVFCGVVWPVAWIIELPTFIVSLIINIGDSIINKFSEKDEF